MAGELPAFAAWVRTLTCYAQDMDPCCDGAVEAHHAGVRGLGQKAHDNTCIPLCTVHHRAWHDHRWPFSSMVKGERRDWALGMISRTQRSWERRRTGKDIPA